MTQHDQKVSKLNYWNQCFSEGWCREMRVLPLPDCLRYPDERPVPRLQAGQPARYLSTGAGYPPRMLQQYPGYGPPVPGMPYQYQQQPQQQQQQAAVKPGGPPLRHHPYPGTPGTRPQVRSPPGWIGILLEDVSAVANVSSYCNAVS